MIRKIDLFCNRGKVRSDTLLAALVLVKRDIETEPPFVLKPCEAAFHPAPGKIPVLIVGKVIIMGSVLNVHVVWGDVTSKSILPAAIFFVVKISLLIMWICPLSKKKPFSTLHLCVQVRYSLLKHYA
jgi:hypothetical protein